MAKFVSSLQAKLIYVFRINDKIHEGCLKVGEATCDDPMALTFTPSSKGLNEAAKNRINQYTQTAGISYELLYTELTIFNNKGKIESFNDGAVHDVLVRSGIKHKYFNTEKQANEWFITDLETVKKAITAVKEGRTSLSANEITTNKSPIIFRPEQQEAIDNTIKQYTKKNSSNQMLWNAKMRFGKTLTALQVIKQMNFNRTLILTHRPVVDKGWFEDYAKIFYDRDNFYYFSKNNGGDVSEESDFHEMIKKSQKNGMKDYHFIYFASIQDMRGSEIVGGKFSKNEEIFNVDWDFIIIDEAHEGTQTELGKNVIAKCRKPDTKVLHLSGTPFNLMDDFKQDEIYTWDYVMEQKAKRDWEELHQGDPNPYASLPKLNIYTYDLGKLYPEYADADIAFNFREFFRIDEDGDFIHEANIKQFLDLITKTDSESNYPYSTQEYRDNFRHSLWMIPGVKEAKALSKLLQQHPVFSQFNIANVAGDGDEEVETSDALKLVEEAITDHPEDTYSITLSCGRLTTGVSVKPWTACFMLAGSYSTAASTYMQTIFRVQTPAIIAGKQKEECFVFDFAPDRTLKVIAETAKISSKAGQTSGNDRKILGEFINFCPIIGFDGSKMKPYDTEKMLGQLKKVYVERVVRNGFEDGYLYNNDLMKLNELELKEFDALKAIIGSTKAQAKTGDIDINVLGLTDEEYEDLGKKKPQKEKRELTPEEEEQRRRLAEAKKNRDAAVSILRGISIRMPLLIYGADLQKNLDGSEDPITIDNFTDLVDELSWKEFMPNGVTKEIFASFKKYYDPDVFRESGARIREMAKAADNLSIEERIERISTIFNTFRNPDKETVLTPWRVVNMHLTDCLGGWKFYNEDYSEPIPEPVYVEQTDVTKAVNKSNSKILEINSKSGLYALFCAYSVYKARAKLELGPKPTRKMELDLWGKVLKENIYLICKTPMAKSISKRTLAGFTEAKVNTHYFEDLVNQLKNKPENFVNKVSKTNYWKKEGIGDMKFDAIVGNPPYQEMDGGAQASSSPVYNEFVTVAEKINPSYVSMIMPSRWMSGGKGLDEFRSKMIHDKQISKLHDFANATEVFPNVEIKGGVCYFLWEKNKSSKCEVYRHDINGISKSERFLSEEGSDIFIRENIGIGIYNKVKQKQEQSFDYLVSQRKPFGLDTAVKGHSDKKDNDIIFYGNKEKSFISIKNIKNNLEWVSKNKVYISYAYGAGEDFPHQILNKPFLGEEGSACSETYLVIGPFDSKEECENVISYIKTRFFRYLVHLIKNTQHATSKVYQFVPVQNFTKNSDIKWTKNVKEIDKQLFVKYELSQEQIEFIEKMIKEM